MQQVTVFFNFMIHKKQIMFNCFAQVLRATCSQRLNIRLIFSKQQEKCLFIQNPNSADINVADAILFCTLFVVMQ